MRIGALMAVTLALVGVALSCEEEPTAPARNSSSSGDGGTSGSKDSGTSGGPNYIFDDGKGTGEKWSDLYAALFEPNSKASCAGAGSSCHASADAQGGQSSKFVCADESGCRESMLSAESKMVEDEDFAKPESSLLVIVLRKKRADGSVGGTQPKTPLFVFHTNSLDRIKTWIKNGAPAD